jgi:hypothetical protein
LSFQLRRLNWKLGTGTGNEKQMETRLKQAAG